MLISVHGGDVLNALAMHDGASVVEIMPIVRKGCPCDMFRDLLTSPEDDSGRIFYYRVEATHASSDHPEYANTFHADVSLSWDALQPLLDTIWHVAADAGRYACVAPALTGARAPTQMAMDQNRFRNLSCSSLA